MIFFDAFLDTYFAYDFNTPYNNERSFTTQPARHNEPNINLIHAGLNLKEAKIRSRVAFQAGNSVEANTSLEANPDLGHIQEAYLGYKISDQSWIDAGIFFSHIGVESWISKNNLTYSRSLLLDYVPYYYAGARWIYSKNDSTEYQFHIVNGWQNISETNSAKSFGGRFQKKTAHFTFTYNNHLGDEKIYPHQKDRFRTYHNFVLEKDFDDTFKGQFSFDVGTQAQQDNDGTDAWTAIAVTLGQKLSGKNRLAYRLEHYADPHEANVITETPNGFNVLSASFNFDHNFSEDILWRNEIRGLHSKDKIYPTEKKDKKEDDDVFIVTSLAVSF